MCGTLHTAPLPAHATSINTNTSSNCGFCRCPYYQGARLGCKLLKGAFPNKTDRTPPPTAQNQQPEPTRTPTNLHPHQPVSCLSPSSRQRPPTNHRTEPPLATESSPLNHPSAPQHCPTQKRPCATHFPQQPTTPHPATQPPPNRHHLSSRGTCRQTGARGRRGGGCTSFPARCGTAAWRGLTT